MSEALFPTPLGSEQEALPREKVRDVIARGQTLPMLDIGDFIAGKAGALEQLAADVGYIQERLGFYYIVNYGFDPKIIDDAYEMNLRLFAAPDADKRRFEHEDHMQGYWSPRKFVNVRPGYEDEPAEDKVGGWAGWTFLRDRRPDDPEVVSNKRHRAMNKWPAPDMAPGYRQTVSLYHREMVKLGLKMVQVYAVALGLPLTYFDRDFDRLEWYSRSNFALGSDAPKGLAASPHSDHSFLTLLPISPVPGLQVRAPGKEAKWIDVAYVKGGIVVNTGEWLSRISNGRFLATPHRVLQPTKPRVSMPVFINPNDQATDATPAELLREGERQKHETSDWHSFFLSYVDGYTNASVPAS